MAKWNILACCLFFIVETCAADIQTNVRYLQRTNIRVKNSIVSDILYSRTKLQCTAACAVSPNCSTIAWNQQTGECLLSQAITTNEFDRVLPIRPKNCEIVEHWTLVSKLQYPLVLVVGPSGRYSMTLSEARAECSLRGMAMATTSDLLSARSMGFEGCSCGWMDDGVLGYVTQSGRPGCGGSTTINVCSDITRGNAWCKI